MQNSSSTIYYILQIFIGGMKKITKLIRKIKTIHSYICKIAWRERLNCYHEDKLLFSLIPLKGSIVNFHKTARLCGKGKLFYNMSWGKRDPFASLLFMAKDARLTLGGHFEVFTNAKIYINEGAELVLNSGYMNHGVNISVFTRIMIGNRVYISENVTIRDSDNHEIYYEGRQKDNIAAPITIGDNVWIGMNVIILKGVTIGDGAIIGAGSVVTRDIPPRCLAVGNPARVIKENVKWE